MFLWSFPGPYPWLLPEAGCWLARTLGLTHCGRSFGQSFACYKLTDLEVSHLEFFWLCSVLFPYSVFVQFMFFIPMANGHRKMMK